MSFKDRAIGLNKKAGIKFMDGREKGTIQDLYNVPVTVIDFGFLKGLDGEYLVFIIKENKEDFYFGATVITDCFKQFTEQEKEEIQTEGLPILLSETKNRKGNRKYQTVLFYPDVEPAQQAETDEELPF